MVKEEDYLLTNQEILGGIKSALARGETLKQAMMSFYQSGYKKEEIEDAARAYLYLQRGASEENVITGMDDRGMAKISPNEKEENGKVQQEKKDGTKVKNEKVIYGYEETKVPLVSGEKQKEEKKVLQKISGYDTPKNLSPQKGKTLTAVLVITLIILLAILGLVFLFKEELINFINGIFG